MNEEITAWLNNQHEWLQEAAHRILTSGSLSRTDIADLLGLLKNPATSAVIPRSFPGIGTGAADSRDLRLISIGPTQGIDALASRAALEFGPGNLTAIYGANGSGKSSYARIITKACGKSHGVDLKPNVYENVPSKRTCTFTFKVETAVKIQEWPPDGAPIDDLRPVQVFDTENGRIYLERETELSFAPPVLAFFGDLVKVCHQVEAELSREESELKSTLPRIPAEYERTGPVESYLHLKHDLDTITLDELLIWKSDDEDQLNSLMQRMSIADPALAARKRRNVKAQIDAIRSAFDRSLIALGEEAYVKLRQLRDRAIAKRNVATEGARALETVSKLDGIGTDTWRRMWEAAREYSTSEAYPNLSFPHTEKESRCVLCNQELDNDARKRLTSFQDYVQGSLERVAQEAEFDYKKALKQIPTRPANEETQTACAAAELSESTTLTVEAAWTSVESLFTPLREGSIPEKSLPLDRGIPELMSRLVSLSESEEESAKRFDAVAKDEDRKQTRNDVVELQAKKWITQQAEAVRAEVSRLKKVEEYHQWKRKTTTTGISRKSGELSETLITTAYIGRFNDELKKLGAERIKVEIVKAPTSYGRTRHSIRLRNVVFSPAKVSEVLSEGERRIVALAAFIADISGYGTNTPLVFDDPVSSLDQVFEEKVISRLVVLSKERQVLVFTHRLSFLGIMNELAGDGFKELHIQREPWGTGHPSGASLFTKKPEKALNFLKNDRIPKSRKARETEGHADYYIHAKAICSDLRILMERIVEIEFLADVVQRHRRAVNTKGKIEKLAKITIADCKLIDDMMSKYSCYEHSHSAEAPMDVPEPAELEADIDRMIAWHTEFSKRTP